MNRANHMINTVLNQTLCETVNYQLMNSLTAHDLNVDQINNWIYSSTDGHPDPDDSDDISKNSKNKKDLITKESNDASVRSDTYGTLILPTTIKEVKWNVQPNTSLVKFPKDPCESTFDSGLQKTPPQIPYRNILVTRPILLTNKSTPLSNTQIHDIHAPRKNDLPRRESFVSQLVSDLEFSATTLTTSTIQETHFTEKSLKPETPPSIPLKLPPESPPVIPPRNPSLVNRPHIPVMSLKSIPPYQRPHETPTHTNDETPVKAPAKPPLATFTPKPVSMTRPNTEDAKIETDDNNLNPLSFFSSHLKKTQFRSSNTTLNVLSNQNSAANQLSNASSHSSQNFPQTSNNCKMVKETGVSSSVVKNLLLQSPVPSSSIKQQQEQEPQNNTYETVSATPISRFEWRPKSSYKPHTTVHTVTPVTSGIRRTTSTISLMTDKPAIPPKNLRMFEKQISRPLVEKVHTHQNSKELNLEPIRSTIVEYEDVAVPFTIPKDDAFSMPDGTVYYSTISYDIPVSSQRQESTVDIVSTWDTESSASFACSWMGEQPFYQHTDIYECLPEPKTKPMNGDEVDENEVVEYVYVSKPTSDDLVMSQQLTTSRMLWCQVEAVIKKNILCGLSERERDFQEAKFEIFTTEASYLKSLTVMKNHFISSPEFSNEDILSRDDKDFLFSYIKPLRRCSKHFLKDLDKCWKSSIYLHGIFEIIYEHAKENFNIYVKYCSYLCDMEEKLTELCKTKKFASTLEILERSDKCSKLPLHDFMTLPMKRITGLALLIKKALTTLAKEDKIDMTEEYDKEHGSCLLALDFVQQICRKCNNGSQTNRRIKEVMELAQKLVFPPEIVQLSLISEKRWLNKHGEMKMHGLLDLDTNNANYGMKNKRTLAKKSNSTLTLFLFNDLLLLTKKKKKKGEDYLMVKDYCNHSQVKILTLKEAPYLHKLMADSDRQFKMLLVLEENHDKSRVEIVLSCSNVTDRELWVKTITEQNATDAYYLDMKHGQMICIYPFLENEQGHLSLQEGDEVTVTNADTNGWLEGVRMRDQKKGIFPASRVKKIRSKPIADSYYDIYNI